MTEEQTQKEIIRLQIVKPLFEDFIHDVKVALYEEHTDREKTFGEREEDCKLLMMDALEEVEELVNNL